MGKLYLGTQAITPILNRGGGGGNEPGGNIKITAYDTTTGVISGGGFGSTPGYVYVLDRDTNTYVPQTVASWTPSSITLDTPVDLTTLEGTTSMAVVADDGTWSNKWLLTGDVAVSGWGKLYVKDSDTGTVYTVAISSQANFGLLYISAGYSTQIVMGGKTFYADEIVGVQFGSSFNLTATNHYLLAYCVNLMQPVVMPSTITAIGQHFMDYCYHFNQPLVISPNLTSIGEYFVANCTDFNQKLVLPSGITSIGNYFLYRDSAFNQPLVIPEYTSTIGSYFLSQTGFNHPLTIPSHVSTIGEAFLSSSHAFNQPITIPSNVTSIGRQFLNGCYVFNSSVTIESGITSIGEMFLRLCYSFNQPITIPSSVTFVGPYFMQQCGALTELTVNTTAHPSDVDSLSTTNSTSKVYLKGITVKGTGRSSWLSGLPNRTSSPYRKLINGGE